MANNYKYYRFYLNEDDLQESEILRYLGSLAGRDRSAYIRECLIKCFRDIDGDQEESWKSLLEKKVIDLENRVLAIENNKKAPVEEVDWHKVWEDSHY